MLRSLALTALLLAVPASAQSILFVGNSFTFGALSPVMEWNARTVTDLNHDGVGGVPALFKRFADEAGLTLDVTLETAAGQTLDWHWRTRQSALDRAWDYVVLQEYSTLDPDRPGDATKLLSASGQLATMFHARNPNVKIGLVATWSRPDPRRLLPERRRGRAEDPGRPVGGRRRRAAGRGAPEGRGRR